MIVKTFFLFLHRNTNITAILEPIIGQYKILNKKQQHIGMWQVALLVNASCVGLAKSAAKL